MKSSSAMIALPTSAPRRRDYQLEFLPAALEIVETSPSPTGRAIGATIIAFFCLAVGWTSFGTIDIVATAPGKIVPTGRTKIVQPFEIGVVRAIHVHDGQRGREGDLLIELDPTIGEAERGHVQGDLIGAQLDVARLRAALANGPDPLASFLPPEGASAALIVTQRRFLLDQTAERRAKLPLDRQTAAAVEVLTGGVTERREDYSGGIAAEALSLLRDIEPCSVTSRRRRRRRRKDDAEFET